MQRMAGMLNLRDNLPGMEMVHSLNKASMRVASLCGFDSFFQDRRAVGFEPRRMPAPAVGGVPRFQFHVQFSGLRLP
jgi:hypothetical protein